MAGLLGYKFEDASEEGTVGELPPGSLDESETATAEIADLRQEDAERVEADAEADDLEGRVELAEELHDEVEPVVTEGLGLDRAGMALLQVGLRRVAGRAGKHLVGRNLKMEAIDAGVAGRREQTSIQFEDLKDTLKQAWKAIKQAFMKAWAKVKTWYIKTFDASKKLKSRATKIRDRAENLTGTIDSSKKSFSFSGIKTLGKNGKIGDAGDVKTGISNLKTLAKDFLDVQDAKTLDDKAEALVDYLDKLKGSDNNAAGVRALKTQIEAAFNTKSVNGTKPSEVDAKIITGLGGEKENQFNFSSVLPGDKVVIAIKGKTGSEEADKIVAAIRRTRLVFSNTKDKPKEASGDAKTANVSQITSICGDVIEIADEIFDFKKGWEGRDSHQSKLLKDIDTTFDQIARDANEDGETKAGNTQARLARSIASAATGLVRRDSSFKASLVGYLMNTSNVALSYCERSLANHS